ncbi:hypothetical protein BX070DRAFT_222173 [Coemansia spiralis]|nr:hypothetical protein BX070DRAFT_222173 [Coemansia spiralis]
MDSFVKSVKSQAFQLDGVDNSSALFPIPIYFWYENANQAADKKFLSPDILVSAYYRALKEFPILAGHLKASSSGKMYIDVDKNSLNLPEFKITQCGIHFQTLKDANFDTTLFPGVFVDECSVTSPPGMYGGTIKIARFHIYRFKDNSGIGIFGGIAHLVVDGYGYYHFMQCWAEISAWMHNNLDCKKNNVLPSYSFVHDRAVLVANRSNETDALGKDTCNAVTSGGVFSKWLVWLSPNVRGRIFRFLESGNQATGCYFHISAQSIESLRISVQEAAPEDAPRYSANDILVALVTIVIAQCKQMDEHDPQNKFASMLNQIIYDKLLGEPAVFTMFLVMDMRPRLTHLANMAYTGNATIGQGIMTPLELLQMEPTPKVLATIASSTRQAVTNTSERFANQYIGAINREPDSYMRLSLSFMKKRWVAVVSNNSRTDFYKLDFGAGIPKLVRPPAHSFPGLVLVLPAHPDIGGYELAFNVTPGVAKRLVQHKFWMSFVDNYVGAT